MQGTLTKEQQKIQYINFINDGVLYPILSYIYLNHFDYFVYDIIDLKSSKIRSISIRYLVYDKEYNIYEINLLIIKAYKLQFKRRLKD